MTFLLLYLGAGLGFAALCLSSEAGDKMRDDVLALLAVCLLFWFPIVVYTTFVVVCIYVGLFLEERRRPK